MISLPLVLIGITLLFIAFLLLRSSSSLKVCSLCLATVTTWIILLLLFYFKSSVDPILIGLLMGGSIVGFLYFAEEKLPEKYSLLKLPTYLTLISSAYLILVNESFYIDVVVILAVIWIFFLVVFVSRNKSVRFKELSKRIINCCKNW